ncbi:MAG: 3-deoxy-manno-octulosonate cytidylyltransferase [Synergistaceae bacterium]|nr:3-deoxy-manno-octulosonate cytidylyltransferase [Synergistaceae bacterium]
MKILGIIPARYASTRFPGKPLADILGKPMIQHVYERAKMSEYLCDVLVATDDRRIHDCVTGFGGYAVMTGSELPNGTARCEEALRLCGSDAEAVINIQGDEPLLDPVMIDEVAGLLRDYGDECATLCRELHGDPANPNAVKVVLSQDWHALYFSRSLIPYKRNRSSLPFYEHIGIYGYTVGFLKEYVSLPGTPLSDAESLEQLKILEHGRKIRVKLTSSTRESIGVDTPEDLVRVREIMNAEI